VTGWSANEAGASTTLSHVDLSLSNIGEKVGVAEQLERLLERLEGPPTIR